MNGSRSLACRVIFVSALIWLFWAADAPAQQVEQQGGFPGMPGGFRGAVNGQFGIQGGQAGRFGFQGGWNGQFGFAGGPHGQFGGQDNANGRFGVQGDQNEQAAGRGQQDMMRQFQDANRLQQWMNQLQSGQSRRSGFGFPGLRNGHFGSQGQQDGQFGSNR